MLRLSSFTIDCIKCLAALVMVFDHINAFIFLWNYEWLEIVGRGAMPLFCFCFALTLNKDFSKKISTAKKLALWGLLAQIPFSGASSYTHYRFYDLNVLFTFSAATLLLGYWQRWDEGCLRNLDKICVLGLVVAIYSLLTGAAYGFAGVGLICLLHRRIHYSDTNNLRRWYTAGIFACVAALNWVSIHSLGLWVKLTLAAVLVSPTLLVLGYWIGHKAETRTRFLSGKALPLFYIGHLLVIWLIGLAIWV